MIEGRTLKVICHTWPSARYNGVLFYGEVAAPATIPTGTTLVVPNQLVISPHAQTPPNPGNIFSPTQMTHDWFALSEDGEMRLYY